MATTTYLFVTLLNALAEGEKIVPTTTEVLVARKKEGRIIFKTMTIETLVKNSTYSKHRIIVEAGGKLSQALFLERGYQLKNGHNAAWIETTRNMKKGLFPSMKSYKTELLQPSLDMQNYVLCNVCNQETVSEEQNGICTSCVLRYGERIKTADLAAY